MNNRFQFYEVVTIVGNDNEKLRPLVGEEGTVLGMSQNEETLHWNYAVSMTAAGIVRCIDEQYLSPTGRHRQRAEFYAGDSVKVDVDPKTGRGSLE